MTEPVGMLDSETTNQGDGSKAPNNMKKYDPIFQEIAKIGGLEKML
jgi:hypothetical protein